jgi:putative phosphoribosyl transferase
MATRQTDRLEPMIFADRADAGRQLAVKLQRFRDESPVVLALPRGGVPVGFEIASALGAPLDVVLVRKIGAPWQPELALGAIVGNGTVERVIDPALLAECDISETYIEEEVARQTAVIEQRRKLYYRNRQSTDVRGCTALVVDDGIATGATMRAALRAIRRREPKKLILAVPVAPVETIEALRKEVDQIVCLAMPDPFWAIGAFYSDFRQVDDRDVLRLLDRAASLQGPR